MKQKNIPLLVMSLLFVGALTYGGVQIASAQKGDFSDDHPLVSTMFKLTGSDYPRMQNVSERGELETEEEHGLEGEGSNNTVREDEDERMRRERSRGDNSEDEREEEDDDDFWESPKQSSVVTAPTQTPISTASPTTQTTITLGQVAQHKTTNDCWMVLQGKVYNVSPYVGRHPGGSAILSGCGGDATTLFTAMGGRGHSQSAWNLLPQFFIGTLGV